jgi:hypothetical protein
MAFWLGIAHPETHVVKLLLFSLGLGLGDPDPHVAVRKGHAGRFLPSRLVGAR